MSFYHAIHASKLLQMPSKKKKEVVSVFFCKGRAEEPEKWFCSDWAENLAKSNKGSYFDQEIWLKRLNKQPSAECAIFI